MLLPLQVAQAVSKTRPKGALVKQLSFGEYEKLSAIERSEWHELGYHTPKCLRAVAPGKWNHQDHQYQIRLVAAWCNCEKCYAVLFNYFKGYPNGRP